MITRRTILKTAAIAPLILPSNVWGATSANSRIAVGLIGMGKENRMLLNMFMARSQVLAVCDVDTTRRDDAKRTVDEFYTNYPTYGKAGCAAYVDFEDLLARKDIDAVVIATPDHWHAIITLAALRAGKDVYCEKPLTHDIGEAIEVMKAVDVNKRVLQTGSQQRSSREFRIACELVRNGAIGKINHIECKFGDPPVPCDLPGEPVEPGLDWNLWVGPAPMRPYNSRLSPRGLHDHWPQWRKYNEFGGGGVTDFGAHHLDIAQWAMGRDNSGPVEILPPEIENAKKGACLVYEDGIRVYHENGLGIDISGQEGHIYVGRGKFSFSRGDELIARFLGREDGGTLESKLTMIEREYLKEAKIRLYNVRTSHVDDFLEAMESRKKPIAHEEIGARSAICCHLMNMVYAHRRSIKWDPDACTFAPGSGNPNWLSGSRRDYRV